MIFIPFMRPEELTLKELLQPLSAHTMPANSSWGDGGQKKEWLQARTAQRREVIMNFMRNKRKRK